MKKSILIVANNMEIGGAERALISLLNVIDCNKYDVDLFLLRHSGEFMQFIPSRINLLPEIREYATLGVPISNVIKDGLLKQAYGRLIGKIKAKSYIKKHNINGVNSVEIEYSYKYTKKYMPIISNKKYDLVIAFSTPYYFVDEKTIGNKKIAWIHTDYSSIPGDTESELKVWSVYDNIVSISDTVTKAFVKKYPTLEDKIVLIENIISSDFIQTQTNLIDVSNQMKKSEDSMSLLSIGRFSTVKNFTSIPSICKKILDTGINIKWYIIGYGAEKEKILEEIEKSCMKDNVIVLGKKDNPYPYIKQCDIYVQPSKFEGKSVSILEAKVLGKPVVVTNFPTAKDQVRDGFDGIIVPMDVEGCANGIIGLINNKSKLEYLINNCKNTNYCNEDEVKKIYELID